MSFQRKDKYTIDDLLRIMELLRSLEGCPWDREQTHTSIRKNFIEETYEVAEAIDIGDTALLKEELGDVLLQVVFHTEMEREKGAFNFDDVCDGICKKLIDRHPHIFGNVAVKDSGEVLRNWEDIKKREKQQSTQSQVLESVPRTLPALMRSEKVQHRAAKVGFDYRDTQGALESLRGEVEELSEAIADGDKTAIADELGDVLFSAANVARFVKVDSEEALGAACEKFIARFSRMEKLANQRGMDTQAMDVDLFDPLWQEVKIKEQ